jgi:hypothetical protein
VQCDGTVADGVRDVRRTTDVDADHPRAGCREQFRGGPPDARPGPRDEGDLAVEAAGAVSLAHVMSTPFRTGHAIAT